MGLEPKDNDTLTIRRRLVLGAGVAAGGASLMTALAGTVARAQQGAPLAKTPASPQPGLTLFEQADLNFQVSFALGEAAYGAGEVGEVAGAIDAIRALTGLESRAEASIEKTNASLGIRSQFIPEPVTV